MYDATFVRRAERGEGSRRSHVGDGDRHGRIRTSVVVIADLETHGLAAGTVAAGGREADRLSWCLVSAVVVEVPSEGQRVAVRVAALPTQCNRAALGHRVRAAGI